jgi:hypothetical protein
MGDASDLVVGKNEAIDAQQLLITGTPDLADDHVDYVNGLEMIVAALTTELATMLTEKNTATDNYET